MDHAIKFSEEVIPLSELKMNPGKAFNKSAQTGRPVFVTTRGKGLGVVQDLEAYEDAQEEKILMREIAKGLVDIAEGRTVSLTEAKQRLGIA